MGLMQSVSFVEMEDEEEEEVEEQEREGRTQREAYGDGEKRHAAMQESKEMMKVDVSDEPEQDPEMVPFESSACPASLVTGNVKSFNSLVHIPPGAIVGDEICTEIYLIRHAESNMNTLPGLIGGRSPSAVVTLEGKRQARALGVFLLSHGLHFDAVFSSPLEQCKQTAVLVCQEVNFAQEKIEFADALVELSQGLWEGLRRSEIYTLELLNVMANLQPDFHAPGGESQRQVEFRMVEFLKNVVLPKAAEASLHKDPKLSHKKQSKTSLLMQVHPLNESDEVRVSEVLIPSAGARSSSLHTKGSGKSRLHIASSDTSTAIAGDMVVASGQPQQEAVPKPTPYCVAVFSHGMAIQCLLQGLLGSDPRMTHCLSIDNTSVTVLRHSTYHGWQIQRVNDMAHLRLL